MTSHWKAGEESAGDSESETMRGTRGLANGTRPGSRRSGKVDEGKANEQAVSTASSKLRGGEKRTLLLVELHACRVGSGWAGGGRCKGDGASRQLWGELSAGSKSDGRCRGGGGRTRSRGRPRPSRAGSRPRAWGRGARPSSLRRAHLYRLAVEGSVCSRWRRWCPPGRLLLAGRGRRVRAGAGRQSSGA